MQTVLKLNVPKLTTVFRKQNFCGITRNVVGKRLFASEPSKEYKHLKITQGLPSKTEEASQSIVYISMNRPELHNAFNEELISEITQAFKSINEGLTAPPERKWNTPYSSTRAVVFTGNGPSFSAGADLNWMKKMVNYTIEENERDSHLLFDMFYSIRSLPCPVIARVNGNALGGGSGLVAACDIALALNVAKFGFTEVKLGLIPAVISPFVVEKIGRGNASRYFLTGERFGPEEARRVGLIQEHFNTEAALDEAVAKLTKEVISSGPRAVAACKSLLKNIAQMDWSDPFTKVYVASEIAKARVSTEGQSGLSAFLNKSKPSWMK